MTTTPKPTSSSTTPINALAKVAEKRKRAKKIPGVTPPEHMPQSGDDMSELRRLVREHSMITRKALAIKGMFADRVIRQGPRAGEIIKCALPYTVQGNLDVTAKALLAEAELLVTKPGGLRDILRRQPIYQKFLKFTPGFAEGWVLGSYLIGFIDIRTGGKDGTTTRGGDVRENRDPIATKLSHIIRYCGFAIGRNAKGLSTGRLERRTEGVKLGYNADLRTRLYVWASVIQKGGHTSIGKSKYFKYFHDTKHRLSNDPRYGLKCVGDGEYVNGSVKGGKAAVHSKAWHKMVHLLVEDLYTVWRTLEGLPVWPSYYSAKLGYIHGGMPTASKFGPAMGPKMLTLDEALATVGLDGK